MRHDLIPRNLRIGQQTLFAFIDVLAKTFLTGVPQPPRGAHTKPSPAARSATTVSQKRWHGTDSQAAMAELSGRGRENRG